MPTPHPIFDANLKDLQIAVFDLETTGLFPSKHAIIQMAAVEIDAAALGANWMSLVDPGVGHRPIPDFIQNYTGIEDGELDGAPNLKEALTNFDDFVGTRIVAGHKVKDFDLKFIRRAEIKTGIDVQSDYYIDTLRLMRRLHPDMDNHKLQTCGEFYGIDFDPETLHDALADTKLCAEVLLHQMDDLEAREVRTFSDMIQFLS